MFPMMSVTLLLKASKVARVVYAGFKLEALHLLLCQTQSKMSAAIVRHTSSETTHVHVMFQNVGLGLIFSEPKSPQQQTFTWRTSSPHAIRSHPIAVSACTCYLCLHLSKGWISQTKTMILFCTFPWNPWAKLYRYLFFFFFYLRVLTYDNIISNRNHLTSRVSEIYHGLELIDSCF